jgi:hypothetical protein
MVPVSGRDYNVSRCASLVTNYHVFAQKKRNSVKIYKKFSAGDEAKQHSCTHITAVPITMRLSILALFIALPAVAYAAVSPRQPSTNSEAKCAENMDLCNEDVPCCDGFCQKVDLISVCPIAHLL